MKKQEYVDEEKAWLEKHADAYREGMQNMQDPAYVRGLLRGIENKLGHALAFNPKEDDAHVACFILGELQAKMEKILTDLDFVDQYEDRRKDFNETLTDIESHKDGDQSGHPGFDDDM